MARKVNKGSSKIKSTKINKEELLANKKNKNNQKNNEEVVHSEFIDNQDAIHNVEEQIEQTFDNVQKVNEQEYENQQSNDNTSNHNDFFNTQDIINAANDVINEAKKMTKRLDDESEVVDNKEQQQLIEKLVLENTNMKETIARFTEENEKLKKALENERQQLIVKLEEKTALARQQLEEKMIKVEQDKQQEVANLKDSIYMDVVTNFLEPYLLFEKTVSSPVQNEAVRAYVDGYNMIVSMFKDSLNNLNVEQILVNIGDEFNANYMEAFDVEEVPNTPPNKVTQIVSKGFIYKGKILKYTSVIVSK